MGVLLCRGVGKEREGVLEVQRITRNNGNPAGLIDLLGSKI